MKKLITLINREFWEQRNIFFTLPVALGGLLVLATLLGFTVPLLTTSMNYSDFYQFSNFLLPQTVIHYFSYMLAIPFSMVLWLTVFYYFLSTLYDDRKDKSILFWQSLPISQTSTLLAKLIAGLILAPFCTLVSMMVTEVIILIFASFTLMLHPITSWTIYWQPLTMITTWLSVFLILLLQGAWLLPLLTWCMLCSAFAKRAPALYAIVSILVLMLIELFFLQKHYFIEFIYSRFSYATQTWNLLSNHFNPNYVTGNNTIWNHLYANNPILISSPSTNMVLGIIISVLFVIAAGVLRTNCYRFEK